MTEKQKFFHGGFGALSVGQSVLPPKITKAPTTANYGARSVCDPTKVYVTTIFDAAVMFAGMHPSGRGKVYEVEPVGDLCEDPDAAERGVSFSCSRAKIKKVFRVKGKTKRLVIRTMMEGGDA